MTFRDLKSAFLQRRKRSFNYWRSVPVRRLRLFMTAAFLLFSIMGFIADLFARGTQPYVIVLGWSAVNGLLSVCYIFVLAHRPRFFPLMILITAVVYAGLPPLSNYLSHLPAFPATSGAVGVRFAATSVLIAVVGSYVFFFTSIAGFIPWLSKPW